MIFVRVIAPALLLLLAHTRDHLARWQRIFAGALVAAWSGYLALPILREARWNLAAPREWDFTCFWLWGRLATRGVDFYDPAEMIALGNSREASDEFSRLILHNGFWYPPPTMLLFAPLGLAPLRIALVVWYVVQAGFAVGAAWLLWRTFLRESGVLGLPIAGALLAMLPPARSTAWFVQTNFMLLFLFLLVLRFNEKAKAGVFLALGAIVKPYFLFLLGYFFIKKSYKPIAIAGAALFYSLLLCAALFGVEPLATFAASNPATRIPGYVVGEPINQSLIGMIVRRSTGTLEGSMLGQPLYLGIAMLLGLTTVWISRRVERDHALGLWLLLALLLYPATLAHYSLVIIAPMLALWRDRRMLPFGTGGVALLAVVMYAILGWDRFESHNFWANLLVWGSVAAASLYLSLTNARQAVVPARS